MIHPRIILLGDTAQASKWVGTGKELARQTYAAGIRNKAYKSDNVEIRVENYLPATEWVRGWSKVWITAGGVDDFLAVVWRPEGIMLTTPYGFPKRTLSELKIDPDTQREYLAGGELINPPFGTLVGTYGSLNQVIINKYPNNKYLDRAEYILGLPTKESLLLDDKITSPIIPFPEVNRRLRASVETPVILEHPVGPQSFLQYWPLFYTPVTCDGDGSYWFNIYTDEEDPKFWIDEPGLNHWRNPYRSQERDPLSNHPLCYNPFIDETVWRTAKRSGYVDVQVKYRQFIVEGGSSYRLEEVIHEAESGQWYCHWPEELLYDNDAYEMVFYLTNQYRDEVGLPPMHREIRGFANAARMAAAENQRAETLYHNNEDKFRQGYGTHIHRIKNAGNNVALSGENLATGFSGGLGLDAGRVIAEGWKGSPGHYANMTNTEWGAAHTSHSVFGAIIAKSTDGVNGVYNPPVVGGFWGQVFNKRDYWVLAGSVNQLTEAGRVSFFSRMSPMGAIHWAYSPELLCYSGRIILVKPIADRVDTHPFTAMLGAALYYKEQVLWVRVVYAWADRDIDPDKESYYFRAITRPVHAAQCDEWVEENTWYLPSSERPNLIGMCTFDHTGSTGIFSVFVKGQSGADFFVPRDPSPGLDYKNPTPYVKKTQVIQYQPVSGFTITNTIQAPDLSYAVTTGTLDEYIYIAQYERNGSGTVNYFPYYQIFTNGAGEAISSSLQYLAMTFDYYVNQTNDGFDTALWTGSAEFKSIQYIDLRTKRFYLCHQHIVNGGIVGECYFNVILYLDPQHDDIVYARINLTEGGSEGQHIYGTMQIYSNETLIKDFPTPILYKADGLKTYNVHLDTYLPPVIKGLWYAADPEQPPVMTVYQVISDGIQHAVDATLHPHPIYVMSEPIAYEICSTAPTVQFHWGRLITGTYPANINGRTATITSCDTYKDGTVDKFNYGYSIGIPFSDFGYNPSIETVLCSGARYQDRFLVNLHLSRLWGFALYGDDQYIVYANFPVEDEVGIGPLKDIIPMGVI